MVTVPNPFGPGYDLATLTEAINIIPNLWGRLQEYNLFPAEGITTRDIAIDLVNVYLTILPEREPGAPATTVGRNEDRSVLSFRVPHIPHEELVLPAPCAQWRPGPPGTRPDRPRQHDAGLPAQGRGRTAQVRADAGIPAHGRPQRHHRRRLGQDALQPLHPRLGSPRSRWISGRGTAATDIDAKINEVLRHIEDNSALAK